MSEKILEVKNLSVLIKDRLLVKNIYLTLEEGECYGIIGEDKSGKTSLLKAVSGTLPISPGQVIFLGEDIYTNKKILTHASTCFDPPVFFKYQSVFENLKYFATLNEIISKEDILKTLKKFKLEDKAKTKVRHLSYFEKKLMSLAIGFLTKPRLLLLDEPFKNLPKDNLKIIKDAIKEIRENGTSVIIATRNLETIEDDCDKFIFMENRTIKQIMNKEEIQKMLIGTTYAFVRVKYPHFIGKMIIENFNLKVKLLDKKILFDADEKLTSQIVRYITKHNMAVYGAGYINKKSEQIFANLTPYFKEEKN